MQPTAQAVGWASEEESPEGAKENVAHLWHSLLHFIFSTRQCRPLIKPEFQSELFAYLGGIIREMDGAALVIKGTSNHVHMLVRIRPVHSAAEIARVAKTNSSRWIHEKGISDFAWQTGYGVFSVSESSVARVEIHCHPGRTPPETFVPG